MSTTDTPGAPLSARLRELALLFLRLGTIAFGGPAAHIAFMRQEVVAGRKWLTDQEFLDLIGATNLIPGPNSTEMAIHLGYRRAGWPGLIVAGVSFILPAMGIVLVLAWSYVQYGTTPEATRLLYGIKPVIIAVVTQALWSLGRAAVKGPFLALVGLAGLALYLTGVNEIALLLVGGLFVMLVRNARRGPISVLATSLAAGQLLSRPSIAASLAPAMPLLPAVDLTKVFLLFLKIGSVLYGSGYVLLAFLRADFVERLRWLTDEQLLDAVAIGQFTPGPVFTTATFVGYLLGGFNGAVIATIGIFLPAFIFVAASHPLIPRLRRSPWTAALLDGVNVASLALMTGVTWQLLRAAVVDVPTAVLGLLATLLLIRFRVNSAWLVLAGAAVGLIVLMLGR
jgi:chromate transporter